MSHRKPAVLLEVNSPFLLSAEVRSVLRCSKRTLIRYYKGYTKSDGRRVRPVLASVRRGGNVLFSRDTITDYISKRTVRA